MGNPRKKEAPFTNNRVNCRAGDKIFFYSDGLTDQLGGEQGMKYGTRRVREVLLENKGLTIPQIEELFRYDFKNWMGKERQLDDVILIGIEI
jgi:serine phosphatase RsbU (regulator of sigma subunit)